ncbi:hypothetical protein SAMN05414137_120205 [Streptacidiphilus jiangxiensis]|uniref:Uncharacterized protein n=2 Tax=Streptacidiphilus jiangxiensis TaxID=235985 RepID=A0A1H7WKW4_STRJI|nr:hypothetical protein SAMN05414137_120205 [Streptacidiphilus jiangxiensis]
MGHLRVISIAMSAITGPATIDQLVADAAAAGYALTTRRIRDWTQAGLLDYPQRRPAGKGHGSHAALYEESQRHLLLTLLHHRQSVSIRGLAQIPVAVWLYWGDEFVPLRQVRVALKTWLGDPRVSRPRARQSAKDILKQFDHPSAAPAARKKLLDLVTDAAYTGRVDLAALERTLRDVFEPGFGTLRRGLGHPSAPLAVDSYVGLIDARLRATKNLARDEFTDDDFRAARTAHLINHVQYAAEQPVLAATAPAGHEDLYAPITAERALNESCDHLLTVLGLGIIYPEQAARFACTPSPHVTLQP